MKLVDPRQIAPAWASNSATALRAFPMICNPTSRAAEAFRNLQTQIYLNWLNRPGGGTVIAVVSPDRGEGRSFVASNLAVLYAQSGLRCLLIDADMRFPKMRNLFQLPDGEGLSSLLRSSSEQFESFYAVNALPDLDNLSVLPVGEWTANPQALLARPAFSALIEIAAKSVDVVLIDTPAGLLFDDAHIIAKAAGAALLVCRKGYTRSARATELVNRLARIDVHMIGTTLTAV